MTATKAIDEKAVEDQTARGVPVLLSKRWILAYAAWVGVFFVYSLRVNMSVAIVCMVKDDNDTSSDNDTSNYNPKCVSEKSNSTNEGEFDWDKSTQSMMLSSFFYGYLVLQVPGGWLAGRIGGKRVLGYSVLATAIATLALPGAARWDYRAVYALRAIMGVAQGVTFPCLHSMWGRWAPAIERTRLVSFSYSGVPLGNIITYICSGLLCAYGFDNGWASIFYIFGGAAFIWVVVWFWVVSDTPEEHPSISKVEREYILNNRGDKVNKNFSVPWLAMAKSKALWICLTAHFCNNWMHYTLLTGIPTFMKEVLKYDIKENGVMSAVPYMCMIVSQIFSGQAADWLRKHYLTTAWTRRLFQSVSFLGSGGLIVAVGFIDCENRTIAVILLSMALTFEGLCYAGYMVNQVDFAPRFAGVLYGITNLISTIPGIVAPMVTGALTPNKSQEEWRNVFYVCGAFTLLGTIVFGGFAVGELEPWANVDEDEDNNKKSVNSDPYELKKDQSGMDNQGFYHNEEKTGTVWKQTEEKSRL